MKQTIKKKASQANGRSRACKKCHFIFRDTDVCKVCRNAFVEGYMKGYKQLKESEVEK